MHKLFSISAVPAAVLGAVSIAYMYYGLWSEGFSGDSGMTIIAFQLWGVLLSGVSFCLAAIALTLARHRQETAYPFTISMMLLSVFSLVSLMIGLKFI